MSVHAFDSSRHRQFYPAPSTTPDNVVVVRPTDVKDTQHVSPAYDQAMNGAANGYQPFHQYPRSSFSEPTSAATLSAAIAHGISAARQLFAKHTSRSNGHGHQLSRSAGDGQISSSLRKPSSSNTGEWRSDVGFILLCCLWYLSSALSSNTGKSIMTRFRYPVTLTFIQFAFVSGYSALCLFGRAQLDQATMSHHHHHHHGGTGGRRPSVSGHSSSRWGIKAASRTMLQGTLMMSFFQIAGHVFSSMAIARVPVSTVHTIKALSPLFTVLSYVGLFGARYSSATYTALLPLTLGVMLACSFDLRANAVGFLCALGSTIVFVSQNIFSKKLLPKESTAGVPTSSTSASTSANRLDKLNLLFYSSGMAFVLMIPIWLYSDAGALMSLWFENDDGGVLAKSAQAMSKAPITPLLLVVYFFLNGSVHFAQNLLAFSILARTSPVTYSIASLVKRIAVICLAIVWSGQSVSLVQALGMCMTFSGLWMYNKAKSDVDKGERIRTVVEKRAEMSLPTTASDLRAMDGVTPPPTFNPSAPTLSSTTPYAGQHREIPNGSLATRNRSVTANPFGQAHNMAPLPPPMSNGGGSKVGAQQTHSLAYASQTPS
ncbi:hypothetical protein OIO90_003049 [Microbotryomycetes sp. JL221]|nr:hypothetical protein OIO90_003049 [Microbotryomycetes sp. JL221]